MIVIVPALVGPVLAVFGLLLYVPALACECAECSSWRRWGRRAIVAGLVLVAAALLLPPSVT